MLLMNLSSRMVLLLFLPKLMVGAPTTLTLTLALAKRNSQSRTHTHMRPCILTCEEK